MHRYAFTLAAVLSAAQSWAGSPPPADPAALAACNATAFQTVLQAAPSVVSPSTPTPQGVWLNRSLLQWPDATASGSFKLYHSATGQLRLKVGQMATGFDGAVALGAATGPIPAALAERFKYVQPGAVLQVLAADVRVKLRCDNA